MQLSVVHPDYAAQVWPTVKPLVIGAECTATEMS
jgi:hypothetical protein